MNITDIDEFSKILTVPKEVITSEIIASVRQLGEKEHLEPFLSNIIGHPDYTPHGPMEIVDIYTHHVHINGKSQTTGFILKGKALQKVTSEKIAYQFLKIPANGAFVFTILACVGVIYDDAKTDFYETIKYKNSIPLILDAHDLARLFIAYNLICKICGNPFETNGICLKGHNRPNSVDLQFSVDEEYVYDIIKTEEPNFGNIKRKSLKIVTDAHYVKQVILKIIDKILDTLLSDQHLDVIWLFFGYDSEDIINNNYFCRVTWVNPKTPKNLVLTSHQVFQGNYSYEISWNSQYQEIKTFLSSKRGNKSEIIELIEDLSIQYINLGEKLIELIGLFKSKSIEERLFIDTFSILSHKITTLNDIYQSNEELNKECSDYRQKFSDLRCSLDNILLINSEKGYAIWGDTQRQFLTNQQIVLFKKGISDLKYERKKL